MGKKDFNWIYETVDFEYRDVKERVKGRYVPVVKFGGTKKYINRNSKDDHDDLNNIIHLKKGWGISDRKRRLEGEHGINRVRFSPDGKYIAGCSTNGVIFLYDLFENKLLSEIITQINNINDITISDDERYIYACGDNCRIELFDIRENRVQFNNNVSKYVDASIYSILKSQENNTEKNFFSDGISDRLEENDYEINKGTGTTDANVLNSIHIPYKTKYRNPSTNKLVYVPIFNYDDMIRNKINIVDVANVYANQINEFVTEPVYAISNSHLLTTACIAVPQKKNYLVYSGGGDGLIKVWDTRSNAFERDDGGGIVGNLGGESTTTYSNKNPYVSFCCHEGTITSVCFNNTLDYEKMAYLERAEMLMRKKKKKKKKVIKKYGLQHFKRLDNYNTQHPSELNEESDWESSESFSSCDSSEISDMYVSLELEEKENKEINESDGINVDPSDSDVSSKFSYSSIEFDLTKRKYNDCYMTSSYDGYVRVFDLNNNILKTYRHENKNVTHAMFSYNNKFIISTTQSRYAQVVDFLYMNNKAAIRDMDDYLERYDKYHLNDKKESKEDKTCIENETNKEKKIEGNENEAEKKTNEGNEEKEKETVRDEEEIIRMIDVYKIKEDEKNHFVPFKVKNIMKDKELCDEIRLVNEFNAIRNKKYRRIARRTGLHHIYNSEPIVRLDRKNFFQSMDVHSDSSEYDEVTRKKKHYYDRINKHFSPLWLYFVEDHHHMNLIPYKNLDESIKENHEYAKEYYAKMRNQNSIPFNESPRYKEQRVKRENHLYTTMSKALLDGFSFPKFYSCVAGDKCLIPSIDTYVHVYDIITGLHVNTINNLYTPNYSIDYSQFFDKRFRDAVQKKVSFITSVDSYPKNQSIVATSNGYPDGSIVLWVYTPF